MSREEAKEILNNNIFDGHVEGTPRFMDAFWMAVDALELLTSYEQTINKLTEAISEQETKAGHWVYLKNNNSFIQTYKCSVCGWIIDSCRGLMQDTGHRLFCEHCGARMKNKEGEDK